MLRIESTCMHKTLHLQGRAYFVPCIAPLWPGRQAAHGKGSTAVLVILGSAAVVYQPPT